MALQIHEFTIPFPGMKRTVLYHFSDCHLAVADDTSTPDEVAEAAKRTKEFDDCRKWFSDHCKEPFDPALTARDYFEEILAATKDGDALLCAGDLAEYFNGATLRYLDQAVAGRTFMSVCGNHDLPERIPDGYAFSGVKAPVQTLELETLTVVGFDDSHRVITPEQLAALRTLLAGEKPLVLLLHIPFALPENEAMLRGCGEYFRLNHDDCPAENLEFVRLITENPQRIVAVLAGHLHFNHTCPITDTLTQFVSSQGMTGHCNKYILGE